MYIISISHFYVSVFQKTTHLTLQSAPDWPIEVPCEMLRSLASVTSPDHVAVS